MSHEKIFHEAWAAMQALRSLDFSANDLYFVVCGNGEIRVELYVSRSPVGAPDFSITCGIIVGDRQEITSAWTKYADGSNAWGEAKALRKWQESSISKLTTALAITLQQKGLLTTARDA